MISADRILLSILFLLTLILLPFIIYGQISVNVIIQNQEKEFDLKGQYKHIPWTKNADCIYKVDEFKYPDNRYSYNIYYGCLTDIFTATGTYQTYEISVF